MRKFLLMKRYEYEINNLKVLNNELRILFILIAKTIFNY